MQLAARRQRCLLRGFSCIAIGADTHGSWPRVGRPTTFNTPVRLDWLGCGGPPQHTAALSSAFGIRKRTLLSLAITQRLPEVVVALWSARGWSVWCHRRDPLCKSWLHHARRQAAESSAMCA